MTPFAARALDRGFPEALVMTMQYQKHEDRTRKPLLREMLDAHFESAHHMKFRVNRSLRDVEPQVNLFVQDLPSRLSESGE